MYITKNVFLHASICLKSKSWGARKFLFQSRFPPFQSKWSTFTLFNWKAAFNLKCLKWCTNGKVNTAEFELDNITTTVGYIQMLNKPANFINESSACINLIFSSKTSIVKNLLSSRRLQEVLVKTNIFLLAVSLQDVFKTFSRRLRDVFKTFCQDVFKTSCKKVFKTSSRRLQDVLKNVF